MYMFRCVEVEVSTANLETDIVGAVLALDVAGQMSLTLYDDDFRCWATF